MAKIRNAVVADCRMTGDELSCCARVTRRILIGGFARQAVVTAELREQYGHARDLRRRLRPGHEKAGEIRIAVEGNEHHLGAVDVADEKPKELMAVVCPVRDLPHLLAASVPR